MCVKKTEYISVFVLQKQSIYIYIHLLTSVLLPGIFFSFFLLPLAMAIQPFFLFIAFFFFVSKLNNTSAAPSATTTTTTVTTTNNNNNYAIGVPIDSEMNALLDIKHSLIDTEGHLNNWVIHLQEQGDGTGAAMVSSA